MQTRVDEIAERIYRLSTYVPDADFTFNQFLICGEQALLFHCGPRALFPLVHEAVARLMPVSALRWISFGHHEADESGALNDWLGVAPQAELAVGEVACMISMNDLAARPPRALADQEVLDLGGKRLRYLATPQLPHGWDAGLLYEESSRMLLCGDLFTALGAQPVRSDSDPVGPAMAAEDLIHATALTPHTAPGIRRLADLLPAGLALMHGPAFGGDCVAALHGLADEYAQRLAMAL